MGKVVDQRGITSKICQCNGIFEPISVQKIVLARKISLPRHNAKSFPWFSSKALKARACLCSVSHTIYGGSIIVSGCFHTCNFFSRELATGPLNNDCLRFTSANLWFCPQVWKLSSHWCWMLSSMIGSHITCCFCFHDGVEKVMQMRQVFLVPQENRNKRIKRRNKWMNLIPTILQIWQQKKWCIELHNQSTRENSSMWMQTWDYEPPK